MRSRRPACRAEFGVKTNAAVIRKALALANVASQHAGSDNTITITSDEGKPPVNVSLAGGSAAYDA